MIGDRIKQRRLELGWTTSELAEKMGYSSRSTISLIEKGKRDITQSRAIQFAEVLGVSVSYLMEWDKPVVDYLVRTKDGEFLVESNTPNDVKKAIELYEKYVKLPPDKRLEFEQFLKFLQSNS